MIKVLWYLFFFLAVSKISLDFTMGENLSHITLLVAQYHR